MFCLNGREPKWILAEAILKSNCSEPLRTGALFILPVRRAGTKLTPQVPPDQEKAELQYAMKQNVTIVIQLWERPQIIRSLVQLQHLDGCRPS